MRSAAAAVVLVAGFIALFVIVYADLMGFKRSRTLFVAGAMPAFFVTCIVSRLDRRYYWLWSTMFAWPLLLLTGWGWLAYGVSPTMNKRAFEVFIALVIAGVCGAICGRWLGNVVARRRTATRRS